MLQFTQLLTLAARIGQQQGGAAEDLGIEFLLAGESAPTAEMCVPGWMSRGEQQRLARGGRR